MSWKKTLEQTLLKWSPTLHDWALLAYLSRPREKEVLPSLRQVPRTVWIETTNACNLNCTMCQTKQSRRPVGYMELSLYEKVVKECKAIGVKQIALHTVGEPFMHKELGEHLRIAHENKVPVALSTNGQILTRKHLESLTKFPPRGIKYSIDGATKETYEKVRRGGKFEKLLTNLRALHRHMKAAGLHIPVTISVVILEENVHELPLFFDVFKEFVRDPADISFSPSITLSGGEAKEFFRKFGARAIPRVPCGMLWGSTSILHDGRVSACCRDYHGELVVGSMLEQSLLNIWHGESYNNLRKKHLTGDASDIPMCNDCFSSVSPSESQKINICLHLDHTRIPSFLNHLIEWAFLPRPYYHLLRHKGSAP